MTTKMSADEVAKGVASLPGWTAEGNECLKRSFKFKDHVTAMGFVTRVAMVAEVMDHHPDLRIVYNKVDIALNTHTAGGVTDKDFALAKKIDAYA